MAHWDWVMTGLALATVLALGGIYMAFFWNSGSKKSVAPKRDMRTTWKVVKLGEPVLEGFGLTDKFEYGVVISSDEMLAQTQTMLFCPLFSGIDEDTRVPLAVLPWHVEVEIRPDADKRNAETGYERKYVSTKIVLPVAAGEIDMDGLERGYLDEHSRIAVSKKLAAWMPQFARLAHG